MTDLRPVEPIGIADPTANTARTGEPVFENVDPLTLFVDPAYQRDLGERGLRQIRKMVEGRAYIKRQTSKEFE